MATSSIFKHFVISGKENVEQFADAIEEMIENPTEIPDVPNARFITDKKDVEEFMRRQKERCFDGK